MWSTVKTMLGVKERQEENIKHVLKIASYAEPS